MAVCIGVYLLLIVFRIRKGKGNRILFIMFLMNTLSFAVFFSGVMGEDNPNVIFRTSYGGGRTKEELQVSVDGQLEKERIEIEVGEQEYRDDEIRQIFQEIIDELDKVVLGENASFDHVDKPLVLITESSKYPVVIQWELDNYEVLTASGEILQESAVEEGTLVNLKAVLSYGAYEAEHVIAAMIYPESKTKEEELLEKIQKSVERQEAQTREEGEFVLPKELDGKRLEWSKKPDYRGYVVLGFGVVICILYVWNQKQDLKEKKEKEKAQMIRDYPDILNQFTLLLSTGVTVKSAWNKIVEDYESRKERSGVRAAYEEMKITCHEMQGGISELQAYERFGKRCDVVIYMKFGALLSQNLRKGSKGLSGLLKMEAMQAFENRKAAARRAGEEAGAKLMIPMFGMLAVVMMVIILPAFFSIQL